MGRETRTIAQHTAIYTIGTVLRNLTSFLMLPIYTRYLTPADYGVIELLSMTIDLFAIVFGLRMGDAVFRYHSHYEERRDKNQVITTAIALVGGLTLLGLMLILALSEDLSLLVFRDPTHSGQISLFAVTLPLVALTEIAFLYLRAEGRPWLTVGFGLGRLMLQLTLNIYFVVIKGLHVDGVIYSAVIANAIAAVLMLAFTIRRTGFSISVSKAGELARFSWPLILSALATFYLTFGNRYLLQVYTDTSEVGIYSLGYKFGFLLLVFAWRPFSSVWDAQRFVIAKKPDAGQEFNLLFTLISTALIAFALCIAVFSKDLLRLMSDEQFWSASEIVPIILVAYVFQAWSGFSRLGILLSGKTIQIALGYALASIVMTLGCLIFIPDFGAIGAAIAVLLGFVVRFFWIYLVSKRHYDMKLEWGTVFKIASLAFAIYGVSTFSPDALASSITFHALEVGAFFVLLFALPIFSPREKDTIVGFARSFRLARPAVRGAD